MIRTKQRGRGAGLTLRAVAIGITASVLVAFVTAWAELVVRDIAIGILQFPPAAFGMFVIMILANRLVRIVRPAASTRAEMPGRRNRHGPPWRGELWRFGKATPDTAAT